MKGANIKLSEKLGSQGQKGEVKLSTAVKARKAEEVDFFVQLKQGYEQSNRELQEELSLLKESIFCMQNRLLENGRQVASLDKIRRTHAIDAKFVDYLTSNLLLIT